MFTRVYAAMLRRRLAEPRRFIQVIAGPRQVGKTTIVSQVLAELSARAVSSSADEPTLRGPEWIAVQWDAARLRAREGQGPPAVLSLDEIQKISNWSETVKRLWDEDTRSRLSLHVVLLGSAPLLIQQGLTESLAGRFEVIRVPHWSFAEMRAAFGFDLDRYLYFGGYPGGATLESEPERWARYIKDSLIETTIARDVLLLTRVDKPALLRRLFELACRYSGQIVAYTKLVAELKDAGNTTTLAHYLELLSGAGMVAGLQKFSGSVVRQRASSPKLQVFNTALLTAQSGLAPDEALHDPDFRGRLVESAVGAHLINASAQGLLETSYWRDNNREVDFVLKRGKALTALEVKSGRARPHLPGMAAFAARYRPKRRVLVGGDGISLEEFLMTPAEHWL